MLIMSLHQRDQEKQPPWVLFPSVSGATVHLRHLGGFCFITIQIQEETSDLEHFVAMLDAGMSIAIATLGHWRAADVAACTTA